MIFGPKIDEREHLGLTKGVRSTGAGNQIRPIGPTLPQILLIVTSTGRSLTTSSTS